MLTRCNVPVFHSHSQEWMLIIFKTKKPSSWFRGFFSQMRFFLFFKYFISFIYRTRRVHSRRWGSTNPSRRWRTVTRAGRSGLKINVALNVSQKRRVASSCRQLVLSLARLTIFPWSVVVAPLTEPDSWHTRYFTSRIAIPRFLLQSWSIK